MATGTDYTIDFSGTKTVKFEVVPVADKEPSVGEAVSITQSVSGGGGGHSGSSGGSKGGSIPWTGSVPTVKNDDKHDDN